MLQPQHLVSNKQPLLSLFNIFVNLVLGFVLIGPLLGLLAASAFYDGNLLQDLTTVKNTKELFYPMLIMQGIASFVGLIALPYLHLRTIEQKKLRPFFPAQSRILFVLLITAFIALNFIISISPISEWNTHVTFPELLRGFEEWARTKEDQLSELTKVATTFNSPVDLIFGLLVIAILPAVGEEFVFRGIIQNELWRGTKNIHTAIWLSAIIFSAIHVQFYGFIPRMLLGALFGYLYYWSGNLLIPIFAHFFNNAFGVIGIYLYRKGTIDINPEGNEVASWQAIVFCTLVTITLLYFFRKFYQQQHSSHAFVEHSDPEL